MLSTKQKEYFLNAIRELRQKLAGLKTENTLQELERFENQLTLQELEDCFFDTTSEGFKTQLTGLLKSRWERIRGSSMCYTQKPHNMVNQLCLKLAIVISPPITTASEIEALEPDTGPYFLLMPSLEKSEDAYGENIHNLGLHEFVLSDKERVFIPLASCLHLASISDEGLLRHVVMIDEKYPELAPSEIGRVSRHSKQVTKLYQSILSLNRQRLLGDDIGAKLRQLAIALRGGGVNSRSGTEYNAGAPANLGILSFHIYWESLSKQKKAAIFAETPELRDIIGRLFRPEDANYKQTRFCVQLLANALDPIIEAYNRKPSIQILQKEIENQEKALNTALKKPQYFVAVQNSNSPKHILPLIFKLSLGEQKKLFKHSDCENAFVYALVAKPEALFEFELELDEESKQQVALAKMTPQNYTGLILAAQFNRINAIELLLRWSADINFQDSEGNDALHWTAVRGHVDSANCLLEHGALLNRKGHWGNTALNWAVYHGHGAVVELLLKKNADINVRNNKEMNALDIAIERHPELVEPILMQLATLPADKQAECLLNVPTGPYPNVLFYAAAQRPSLFNALIATTVQQPNITAKDTLFTIPNQRGITPLILAAQLGAKESIDKLINLGLDIQSRDNNGSDALNWAATRGYVDAVNCLLGRGALLEAKGHSNNTALNWAVYHGRKAVVQLLLKRNADINVRNNQEMNALDIAIKYHRELVEPILMHLATLPADKQAECLRNVPTGPYPNVLFYAAAQRTSLFNALIDTILKQPNITVKDALFTTSDQSGFTPLILAAQLGAKQSIDRLIDLGLDIQSHDNNGNDALNWAANKGHMDAVNCLLERGALLDTKGCSNNTALNWAVYYGRRAMVKLLLKRNADINVRNNQGMNALDIAIKYHPELVEPILMQLATLPADKQAECLLNLPKGPYPNVLFYAVTVDSNLLKNLLHSFNNSNLDSKMQNILEHIHQIGLHYKKMKRKASHNSNYKTAVSVAETLLETCTNEMLKVYQSGDDIDVKMLEFKTICNEAVQTARPVLTKHREWGKVLAAFLLAVITLPVSLSLYGSGFFSIKTKSEQLLDNFQTEMNKPG